MKILFEELEPFISELSREAKDGNVWRKQVRFDIVNKPEQQERISFRVGLILAALIDTGADGQFIMESVIDCGSDDPDNDPRDAGSQVAKYKLQDLHEAATKFGLAVLPGRLQE